MPSSTVSQMPKRKVTLTAKTPAPRRRTKARQLVWVDQRPLRREAASECGRAMQRLEKARSEWKRYEREDQPAYQRWMASTFGALMSRVREIEALVREKELLVREVEKEMYISGSTSYRTAYARVQRRRANPAAEPDPRTKERDPRFSDDEETELDEFTQELLFEEFVRTFLGMNPDRMSDRQHARMFADFKAKVLGQDRPEPPPPFEPEPDALPEPPKSDQNRVKELYRLLVRRLHPDMRADNNTEVSAIWHDVQEAYATGNVERLEMLLAFTDIQSNTAGEHTSLFQMRSVFAELRNAFNALQRTLRTAKKDHAWNFARRKDRSKVEGRVRREMETTLAWNEDQLRELNALIAQWSAPPNSSSARQPRKPRQAEFRY
ncbi:MAG: J domain-containing protein [Chthoniobacter sp.]|uniref:J domain-containing protein n=1 Tax=Chthoniobacter sp. TaxID=2510640 RepID=UPI0032AD129B